MAAPEVLPPRSSDTVPRSTPAPYSAAAPQSHCRSDRNSVMEGRPYRCCAPGQARLVAGGGPRGEERDDLRRAVRLALLELAGVLRRELPAVGVEDDEHRDPVPGGVAVPRDHIRVSLDAPARVHVDHDDDKAPAERD